MFSKKTMASFSVKYDVDHSSGCWLWNASNARGGYGQFITSKIDGKKWYRAHRFSYEAHVGEIPDGMVVMHTCDNPACVNPSHLILGTQADNIADRDAKGRGHWQGDGHRTFILSQEDLNEIVSSTKSDRQLAEKFQCSRAWIWKLRKGKISWAKKVVQSA